MRAIVLKLSTAIILLCLFLLGFFFYLLHFFHRLPFSLFHWCLIHLFFFLPGLLLTSASKTPSAPSSSDFLSFSDSSLRPGGGTTFSSPPSFSSCLMKPSSEGGASEGTSTLFGSLMSATTASAGVRYLCLYVYVLLWRHVDASSEVRVSQALE